MAFLASTRSKLNKGTWRWWFSKVRFVSSLLWPRVVFLSATARYMWLLLRNESNNCDCSLYVDLWLRNKSEQTKTQSNSYRYPFITESNGLAPTISVPSFYLKPTHIQIKNHVIHVSPERSKICEVAWSSLVTAARGDETCTQQRLKVPPLQLSGTLCYEVENRRTSWLSVKWKM